MGTHYATDPYAVLGVAPNVTPAELKRAYRNLARDHHPDRNPGDPGAEARFKAIAEAYATVTDPAWQRSKADRSEIPEAYLGDFTDALERAEALVFRELLPRYRALSGRGERVVQLARDLSTGGLRERAQGPAPAWWARALVRWDLRRISVHIDYGRSRRARAEVWPLNTGGWAVVLYPSAFWSAGAREAVALDDAVLETLAAQIAAIQAEPLRIPFGAVDHWDALLERVREDDRQEARWLWTRRLAWTCVALLSALLLWLGASAR